MMDVELSEYELTLRAREGDREALAELVERTRLRLFSLAYAELRHYEDAQDAVAAALHQICRHISELREPERARAWMQSIVRREVYRLRRGAGASVISLEDVPEPLDDAEPSPLRLDIERALRQLPGDQARAIRMYYLDGLSTREIGRRLGRAEGTVTSWLHRGRRHLAAQMEDYAPMTPSAPTTNCAAPTLPAAALIHTDLDPVLTRQVREALLAGGFSPTVITPADRSRLLESLSELDYQYLVMDEVIGGRSALELFINLRANPETRRVPVCILCADLSDFTASAYFCIGVDRVVRKEDDVAAVGAPITRNLEGVRKFLGSSLQHTRRAMRATFAACDEAAARGLWDVDTEHLLLALIYEGESGAARLLDERLGVSLEQIRSQIEPPLASSPIHTKHGMRMTPRGLRAGDLAEAEARRLGHECVGTEHLLLGLLREQEGRAAKILAELGVTLERARQAVREARLHRKAREG